MNQKIPPLERSYNSFANEDKHLALINFTREASIHFPAILDSDRDRAAAKIHLENIEEHISRTNQNTGA